MFLTGGCGKDNRTILHSEAFQVDKNFKPKKKIIRSTYTTIKDVAWFVDSDIAFHNLINLSSVARILASRFKDISKIYDVSDELDEEWLNDKWYILFSVETTGGKIYTGFRCLALLHDRGLEYNPGGPLLRLSNCATDDAGGVELGEESIEIRLKNISVPRVVD